jgi:hypothetical protein
MNCFSGTPAAGAGDGAVTAHHLFTLLSDHCGLRRRASLALLSSGLVARSKETLLRVMCEQTCWSHRREGSSIPKPYPTATFVGGLRVENLSGYDCRHTEDGSGVPSNQSYIEVLCVTRLLAAKA